MAEAKLNFDVSSMKDMIELVRDAYRAGYTDGDMDIAFYARFLKFTNPDNHEPILVRADQVEYIYPANGCATVCIKGDKKFWIEESGGKVIEILRQADCVIYGDDE